MSALPPNPLASPPPNRFGLPNLGYGMGLRAVHYAHILSARPAVDWFEVISENYMDTGGRPAEVLSEVAAHYPVVMHGVSLSIGSTDPLDMAYLRALRALADRVRAVWVSDHLCWTGVASRNSHDLLPLPYDRPTLRHVVARVQRVQDLLGRPLILENPSTYLAFAASTMTEWDFLAELAQAADCGLLLDVNNVYVSCFNHGWHAPTYLNTLPADRVVQYHLAGHTHKGTHILDTHSDHVIDAVWGLYGDALSLTGPRATLLEWDDDIPSFEVVHAEARKAHAVATARGYHVA